MRGNVFLILGAGLALLFTLSAVADETSGRTADGCSYKVINGQYLTSCSKGTTAAAAPTARYVEARPAPVTDYGSVPVYRNAAAPAPALPPQQPSVSYGTASVSSIERDDAAFDLGNDDLRRARLHNKLVDQTYVGVQLGASNMKESNAGSSTGFGLEIGTNIDDTFGVEIGYTYAKQNLGLGLASRGASTGGSNDDSKMNTDPNNSGGSSGTSPPVGDSTSDCTLASNLFRGEVLAHLTDPVKRLRPYVGAGLGWRTASLSENASSSAYGQSLSGGSLHQSALGALATAGTKLRITKTVSLSFSFDYYLPVVRQEARLEQPLTNTYAGPLTKLSAADDSLTGSAQYQILGGVQYSF